MDIRIDRFIDSGDGLIIHNPLETNSNKINSLADIKAGVLIENLFNPSLLDLVDLRILICHALKLTHTQLILNLKNKLKEKEADLLRGVLSRRQNGEPVAYIIGEREFYGLSFAVTPDVLIPRPETELLVELAIQFLPKNAHLLDMGTGSGSIAVAIAYERKDVFVTATDISETALEVAKCNVNRHIQNKERISFHQGSWFLALPDQAQYDLIVSNPPYIEKGNIHLSQGDLRYEPLHALTDFDDGLSAYREIVSNAPKYLKKGGLLMMEHGYEQANAVRSLLESKGFISIKSWKDLAGIERVSGGVFMK